MDAARRSLADEIDALLPQTQCRRCGHAGCRPYAVAIERGEAINRCAPGGDATIASLAALTRRPRIPLDPAYGRAAPLALARIDEEACIGCTLCIDACPVDAIVGAAKRMHTVIAALCTGCELCVAPCPVDCIAMVAAGRAWSVSDAHAARSRYEAHNARQTAQARHARTVAAVPASAQDPERARREDAVARALARARARRAARAVAAKA